MKNDEIPVNPAIIRWARQQAGCKIAEVVEKFKKIESWESGETSPTYPQLEQISDYFKIPVAVFFFPSEPQLEEINETFRTISRENFNQIPRSIRLMLRKAKAMQINLHELYKDQTEIKTTFVNSFAFTINDSISKMATEVRKHLNVSFDEQSSWKNSEEAFKEWRKIFINYGINVFKDAFKNDNYSGFCIYDTLYPIIYVNNSTPATRQIFTLFHELAHLIFRTSGIDTSNKDLINKSNREYEKIEIIANKFAAEFLLPDDRLENEMKNREASTETAELLAQKYNVSRELVFRKFLDRKQISKAEYEYFASEWSTQNKNKDKNPGGTFYNTKIAYLGRDYIRMALSQYYRNKIDSDQLADYLDVKPKHLISLEEKYMQGEL